MRNWAGCKYTHTFGEMVAGLKGNKKYSRCFGYGNFPSSYKPEMLKNLIKKKDFIVFLKKNGCQSQAEVRGSSYIENSYHRCKFRTYYDIGETFYILERKYPLEFKSFEDKFIEELSIINASSHGAAWNTICNQLQFDFFNGKFWEYNEFTDKFLRKKASDEMKILIRYFIQARMLLSRLRSEIKRHATKTK